MSNYDGSTYTKPELREQLKEKIKESKKGGRPGQWSARKAQLLSKRYEDEGGGYVNEGEKNASQKSLQNWTAEDWQTVDGTNAERKNGMKRYLPAKAWAMLNEVEQEEADCSKLAEDAEGNQYADWPDSVRRAMTALGHTGEDPQALRKETLETYARRLEIEGTASMNKDELVEAIQKSEVNTENKKNKLQDKTKSELYEMAKEQELDGRSKMDKRELVEALQ